MSDYISREVAIKLFNFAVLDCLGMEPTIRAGDIIKALESIPAADVRSVVRGKWKKVGTQMHLNLDNAREQYRELGYPHRNIECLQCSNCRKVSMVDESILYEFCPNCGADMREEN